MALDFSLADFLQSRGQAPAAPTLSDVIGFDQNAAADNNAASNALLESILLNMRQAPQPKSQNILESLASSFDARQPAASADYILRGNPSAPSATATNPLLEAVAQAASRSGWDEPSVSPNSITGDIRRSVDVPAVMAANTAMFQRTMPKNVPQGRVIYPPAQLPPIFQAIKEAQTGATELSGYDPKNPPRAHTISKQQFMALPPLMQQQYLQATKERHGKIQDAKRQYETLFGETTRSAISKDRDSSFAALKKDEDDAKIATQDLEDATQKQFAADTKLKDAAAKFAEWRTKVDTAVARGWIKVDPKTKAITAIDKTIAGTAKEVDARIAERAQIETDIAEATKEQKQAAVEFGKAQDKARKVGVRATSSESSIATTSANETVRFTKDGRPAIFDATTKRFIRYAQ